MWVYAGNLLWSKFNALLVAHSLVLAAYGFLSAANPLPTAFSRGLPIAGLILCVVWALLLRRGFDTCRLLDFCGTGD